MALIICPECGKEISDKAQACLHCGKPMQKEKEYILDVSLPGSCKAANLDLSPILCKLQKPV